MSYAEGTSVPVEKTRMELERVLVRYGASAFASSWDATKASVGFAFKGWHVRLDVRLPDPKENRFTIHRGTGKCRTAEGQRRAYDDELRRLWRAMLMVVKMKLEAVASGITTFENEFLAHLVLPGGSTVGENALPRLMAMRANSHAPTDPLPSLPPAGRG